MRPGYTSITTNKKLPACNGKPRLPNTLKDYLHRGNTFNVYYYADLLAKIRKVVTRKQGLARTENLRLPQGNMPSHKARLVQMTVNHLNIEILHTHHILEI